MRTQALITSRARMHATQGSAIPSIRSRGAACTGHQGQPPGQSCLGTARCNYRCQTGAPPVRLGTPGLPSRCVRHCKDKRVDLDVPAGQGHEPSSIAAPIAGPGDIDSDHPPTSQTGGTPQLESLLYWIGISGSAAFAVSAVLVVAPKHVDLLSAIVFGIITAVGGGTIRDLILDVPVFWIGDLNYLWVAIVASVVTFFAHPLLGRKAIFQLILYIDGLGAALFAVQAADKAWNLEFGGVLVPIILGVTTAIGGGLIRDVLAGRPTLLMNRELYATPVMIGCTMYITLVAFLPEHRSTSAIACVIFIFAQRAAAIRWNLAVPDWLMSRSTSS